MDEYQLIKAWGRFTEGKDFKLNPDNAHVEMVAEGVLKNRKEYGLGLCPCRLSDGTKERDMELICPCKFKTHRTWESEGRCWCGLFVKR
jgi:ferredoxin-thioredoxin reductase catalytic subunit